MPEAQRAHSQRIIGSAIYDGLIVLGLLMIAGFIAVLLNYWLTGDKTINEYKIVFQLYLLITVIAYFLYFWQRSGQTVGMKAWRIKLINLDDGHFTYPQLILRLLTAIPAYGCLFLGVLWQYINTQQLNWHDMASHSKIVHLPKVKIPKP